MHVMADLPDRHYQGQEYACALQSSRLQHPVQLQFG